MARDSETPVTDTAAVAERYAAWVGEALELAARTSGSDDVPVGAVVIGADNVVIGRGRNVREQLGDPTGHAEIMALREAAAAIGSWRLDGATLVATLEPCVMCAGAALSARIGRLVYGAADLKAGASASLYNVLADPRLNHNPPVAHGVLARECGELITAFFTERRR